jgi:hypothetical protein
LPGADRGLALAASVFALAVIGALVAAAFFAARQELRIGLNSRASLRALAAAEAGLNTTVANVSGGMPDSLAVGDSMPFSGSLGSGAGGAYSGTVLRLNGELFLIRAVGSDPTGSARRRLAMLIRFQADGSPIAAALTSVGPVAVRGSARLDGVDVDPLGWDCPARVADTVPEVAPPANILDWDALVAMATKTYPAGAVEPLGTLVPAGTATTCDASAPLNWGEPRRPAEVAGCAGYYPTIYAAGNLAISGGTGQGILLVAGDLDVFGGAEFYGLVVVQGTLRMSGSGGRLIGGVGAGAVDLAPGGPANSTGITYSSCAVYRVFRQNFRIRRVRERSWAELPWG